MYALNVIVLILLIIGGLNWGLVGVANYDLVANVFAVVPIIARIIYILVGLAAIYAIVYFGWYVKTCEYPREAEYRDHTTHPSA